MFHNFIFRLCSYANKNNSNKYVFPLMHNYHYFRRFLEAPVSGSKAPAVNGVLIFLCAGSKDLFDEVEGKGLAAMGKASHFLNTEVGYGTKAKLVVNSLMGTMVAALSESLALSTSVGLDPLKIIEVIGQGAIAR